MKTTILAGTAMALALSSALAFAQGPGYGMGPGPGMMGPGYGPGPGGAIASLNLSDEQREKIAAIREEHRRKNWDAMGQMQSEMFKLRQLYRAEKLDAGAIAEQQKKVDELRRQLIKSRVETRNQISALLTKEQQQQFRRYTPWWMLEAPDE